jgi:hypothetical protein
LEKMARGEGVETPVAALIAMALTRDEGLPERAADKRSVKRPTKKAKEA